MSRSSLRIEPLSVRISMLVFLGSKPQGSHHHNITFPYQLLTHCSLLNFLPVAYCVHLFNWPLVMCTLQPNQPRFPTITHCTAWLSWFASWHRQLLSAFTGTVPIVVHIFTHLTTSAQSCKCNV